MIEGGLFFIEHEHLWFLTPHYGDALKLCSSAFSAKVEVSPNMPNFHQVELDWRDMKGAFGIN